MAGGTGHDIINLTPVMLKVDLTRESLVGYFLQLREMYGQKHLTDFRIKTKEEEIACHKVLLAAHSSFFWDLFNRSDTGDGNPESVDLSSLPSSALKSVLEYFYSGKLHVPMQDAQHIIEVVSHLKMKYLEIQLIDQIVNGINLENCVTWYLNAPRFGLDDAYDLAMDTMLRNLLDVAELPDFLKLECKYIEDILDALLDEAGEHDTALVVAAKWIMHDVQERQENFEDILQLIDINNCSASALTHILTEYGPYLITSAELKDQFTQAILDKVPKWQEPEADGQFDVMVLAGNTDTDYSAAAFNRKTWKFNLKTGVIKDAAPLPTALSGQFFPAMCSAAKGAIFAGGGSGVEEGVCAEVTDQCVLYNKVENVWSLLPELPVETYAAGAAFVEKKNKLYVMGGCSDRTSMSCLDLATKSWSKCPDLLQGLVYPLVSCVEGKIYVIYATIEFNEREKAEISMQCFDSATNSWSYKASLPPSVTDTMGSSVVSVDHQLFLVGGNEATCLSYDTLTDSWTVLTPPIEHHYWGSAVSVKGKIVLSGGLHDEKALSRCIECYDPETDAWQKLPVKLPDPLLKHSMITA